MQSVPIAIVGMACCYPDASTPQELWENVLARRRAFRPLPQERLNLNDYQSDDADGITAIQAALIKDYHFDRIHYRVSGTAYRSTDLSHWLALDIATQALTDAGFLEQYDLPQKTTGVLVGNTLTGEFSRASLLRLRWPYVRRVVNERLQQQGWESAQRQDFLCALEARYKQAFPVPNEETLAGGLSNTIAGRICNHFDLGGGGYTLDGACSSSLLAVANACTALTVGDLDVAVTGGVDLSLDPFELVGFSRAGALASEEMRVYDQAATGFWPGEGCGFVVLMREADALALGMRCYASIRGWGIASDGSGGMTRPESDGQMLAIDRAYRRAGYGIESVALFEGHGTGTAIGDEVELRALVHARAQAAVEASADTSSAVIGSIKANIGHTKAAAGVAGLIKTVMALYHQVLPPTTGCERPHPLLQHQASGLRPELRGALWPSDQALHAGVSSFGFGGINAHMTLQSIAETRRRDLTEREKQLLAGVQDSELFLFGASESHSLAVHVQQMLSYAARLSRAELTDLAAALARQPGERRIRAALVAATPAELVSQLKRLAAWLEQGETHRFDPAGLCLSNRQTARIAFLFPGQAAPVRLDGGAMAQRFVMISDLYHQAALPTATGTDSDSDTAVAQPAIVTAELAALKILTALGVVADLSVGHSLGELLALHWAGAIDEMTLLEIARIRGQAMSHVPGPAGAMVSIGADSASVAELLDGLCGVSIAGFNTPHQCVVSGTVQAIEELLRRTQQRGVQATRLAVSHAFHSPLMAPAAESLAEYLTTADIRPLQKPIVSTVTGAYLSAETDLRKLLLEQLTQPVRFTEALTVALADVDVSFELGPGRILSGLVQAQTDLPVFAVEAADTSLRGLLQVLGAAYAAGASLDREALFAGRLTRPFEFGWQPVFFANPCESVASADLETLALPLQQKRVSDEAEAALNPIVDDHNALEILRTLVATKAELPLDAVVDDSRLLVDLHLNSIAVGQIVAEASRSLGLQASVAPNEYADATLGQIAQALEESRITGDGGEFTQAIPEGVDTWVRVFVETFKPRPLGTLCIDQAALPGEGGWTVLAAENCNVALQLQQALNRCRGGGIAVVLSADPKADTVPVLLQAAHQVIERKNACFVLIQQGHSAASFARTLYLESKALTVCVVNWSGHQQAVESILSEIAQARGYHEVYYDHQGKRTQSGWTLLPQQRIPASVTLGSDDILLVSGGGKGIAAECARALATDSGASLVLLGRSKLDEDLELRTNLERLDLLGIRYLYLTADVTDARAVNAAISHAVAELGPITALLHGAGLNQPALLNDLDEAAFRRTMAPKLDGLRNLLAAIDQRSLKLLVGFGSIIARSGLPGEADYGLANEYLARDIAAYQRTHPHCRCLTLEWSIWSGVGMGERLGRVDALAQAGITPITPDQGIAILQDLLKYDLPQPCVVISGRLPDAPTLPKEQPELPFWRFLEQPRVYFPGVELVVDVELSAITDPYVGDHIFQGESLLPAVMGLEAMAQVAVALHGDTQLPVFEAIKFMHPVVIPEQGTATLRLAALVREPGCIDVVIRYSQTGFKVDHFRASCRFGTTTVAESAAVAAAQIAPIDLDPQTELYGGLLFQSGRFCRLTSYQHLQATSCLAHIESDPDDVWFNRYLPEDLLLGDPGSRDATIHAIQACIPHARLLPVAVERLVFVSPITAGSCTVQAEECWQRGDLFCYNLEVRNQNGQLRERWYGLQLRKVADIDTAKSAWPAALLIPYLERRLQEWMSDTTLRVALEQGLQRQQRRQCALARLLGSKVQLVHRPDGKPELMNAAQSVSVAHDESMTLMVISRHPVACDLESVQSRSQLAWQDLLGAQNWGLAQHIAMTLKETEHQSATRVWCAKECLKKAGISIDAPLTFMNHATDDWVLFAAGHLVIASYALTLSERATPVVVAVLADQIQNDHSSTQLARLAS